MLEAIGAGGVSAQRITQGKDHFAQDSKMVSAPVVLPDGWKIVPVEPTPPMVEAGATERITPHITAGHGAIAAFKAMLEHAPEYPALASTTAAAPAVLNLDDYYCKGCGRIGEIEELNAQDKEKLRKIEGKPKTVAAPVEVVIDFERVGSAGPFEVVEGRVAIPVVTMLDLARWLKPTTDALSAAPVVLPEENK